MPRQEKDCFVLQFRLKTELWQEDVIDGRLEAGRQIYNSLLSKSLKRLQELQKTKRYRSLMASITHEPKHDKPIWRYINQLRKEAGLTEYGLSKMVTPLRQHFKTQVGSQLAQKLSKSLWRAYDNLFYGNGKQIEFKKFGQLNSLEGKNNAAGIIFKKEQRICYWSDLTIPVEVDVKNAYEMEALELPIAYCRVLRKFVRGKKKYYLQIVFRGEKPAKRRRQDGSFVNILGKGEVGIDIGVSIVAYASESDVKICELADRAQVQEQEKKRLQRKLERSRRANNPEKYNADGTAKKGAHGWVRSNRYLKNLFLLKEIHRKQAAVRKLQHEMLANELLQQGDTFYVEALDFDSMRRKPKKSGQDEDGQTKYKLRFGKSLANRAPSMFLDVLERKLRYFGKELIRIDPVKARVSQFNHVTGIYEKKPLAKRWIMIEEHRVQRNMYAAFLIQNINPDLKSFDVQKCQKRFASFLEKHDWEIKRLSGRKN